MVAVRADRSWERELEKWFAPFSEALSNKKQRFWGVVYLEGLLGPDVRKSIVPITERLVPGDQDQLNHFVNQSPWAPDPLQAILVSKANALVGGRDSFLIIDDTALVKKGRMSVGVSHQYCGELGKKANCQVLVSLTLARGEVPMPVSLRLFLPEAWASDRARRKKCRVPEEVAFREKWRIALDEVDRVMEAGARFGVILADAAYGKVGAFRQGLIDRGLFYVVGLQPNQKAYPADATVTMKKKTGRGRPPLHPTPSTEDQSVEALVAAHPRKAWRTIRWRQGTKGALSGRFFALRIRMAEGKKISRGKRLPADRDQWLLCEERQNGERRYYLSNLPAGTPLRELVAAAKARWSCEQAHQQMKQELGLDHYEGRSWPGLHHHVLLTLIAFGFLQHLRLGGKKKTPDKGTRRSAS